MTARRENIVLATWKRLWRKAGHRSRTPGRRWERFCEMLNREGRAAVRDVLLLCAPGEKDARALAGELAPCVEPGHLFILGALDAWRQAADRKAFGSWLHEAFAAQFDPESEEWRQSLQTWENPEARAELFASLPGDVLFEVYFKTPHRAAAVGAAMGEGSARLLEKASVDVSDERWLELPLDEIVPACLRAGPEGRPPAAPRQPDELAAPVAEQWMRVLAQKRMEYALRHRSTEAWDVVPCTWSGEWERTYNESLVETASAHLARESGILNAFPPFVLDKLCEPRDKREIVTQALLDILETCGCDALPDGLAEWMLAHLKQAPGGALSEVLLERLRAGRVKPAALPAGWRAVLQQAALRSVAELPSPSPPELEAIERELRRNLVNEGPG